MRTRISSKAAFFSYRSLKVPLKPFHISHLYKKQHKVEEINKGQEARQELSVIRMKVHPTLWHPRCHSHQHESNSNFSFQCLFLLFPPTTLPSASLHNPVWKQEFCCYYSTRKIWIQAPCGHYYSYNKNNWSFSCILIHHASWMISLKTFSVVYIEWY